MIFLSRLIYISAWGEEMHSEVPASRLTGVILCDFKSQCFTLVWSSGWQMVTRPDLFSTLISVNSSSLLERSFKLKTCNNILPNTAFIKGVNGAITIQVSMVPLSVGCWLVHQLGWILSTVRSPDILWVPPRGWFILIVHTEQFDGFPLNVMFPTKQSTLASVNLSSIQGAKTTEYLQN